MDSDEMECTQVLDDSVYKPKRSEESINSGGKQVATLDINGKQFAIFNGDSKIGRDAKQCCILIDKRSVSAHHALIEVESGHHLICDLGSSNSTRLDGMLLKPHVRYNLKDGSAISIADLRGTYKILSDKISECDTSLDLFETPAKQNIRLKSQTPNCGALNNSYDDDSIIASTPMKPEFKLPFPKRQSTSSAHDVSTERESDNSSLFDSSMDVSTPNLKRVISSFVVPCSQQADSDSSLNLHYNSDKSADATGFECEAAEHSSAVAAKPTTTKDNPNESAIPDLDLLYNESTEVNSNSVSESLNESGAGDGDDIYGGIIEQELNFIEKKIIEDELDLIERRLSSEGNTMGNNDRTLPCNSRKQSDSASQIEHIENKQTSSVKNVCKESSIYEADTQVFSDYENDSKLETSQKEEPNKHNQTETVLKEKSNDTSDIYEAKTQIMISTGDSDSETDDGGVLSPAPGASSLRHIEDAEDDIHNAKTQVGAVSASGLETEEVIASEASSNPNVEDDVHSAKTQVVWGNASGSETDDEQNFSSAQSKHEDELSNLKIPEASSGEPKKNKIKDGEDEIHNAKTQVLKMNVLSSDTDEELVFVSATEVPLDIDAKVNEDDIHNSKTQLVSTNTSDLETDEEGAFGAASELSKSTNVNNDMYGASTEVPKSDDDIHNAKTQIVTETASDSETDEEGVYGVATEAPKTDSMKANEDDIHTVETVASTATSDEEEVYGAATEAPKSTSNDDIHDARTQISTCASDSETDEEGMYGAATEVPKSSNIVDDIHNAKTQAISTNASKSETDEEGVHRAATEPLKIEDKKTNGDDIHNSKTQIVTGSKTDEDSDVYGAATEVPEINPGDDIHNAKTQMVTSNASDSETDEEGVYGAATEVLKSNNVVDDIHNARTQIVDDIQNSKTQIVDDIHNAKTQIVTGSKTDEDSDVNGAATEVPEINPEDDIHNAKTQMVTSNASDSETDEEGVHRAATEPLKIEDKKNSGGDIHNSKTQIVTGSKTDEDSDVYGAATEVPEINPEDDIHNAKTQMVTSNASDSETDEEGVYGAATEVLKSNNVVDDIHNARTQIVVDIHNSKTQIVDDIHNAKTQIVTGSKTDEDSDVYGAATEVPEINPEDDIHNAKTQMVTSNASDSETDEEGVYGTATEVLKSNNVVDDIHNCKTQIVNTNASDSETDEEGMYGAASKAITHTHEDIHDAKTQIVECGDVIDPDPDGDRSSSVTPDLPELLIKSHSSSEKDKKETSVEAATAPLMLNDSGKSNQPSNVSNKEIMISTSPNKLDKKGNNLVNPTVETLNHCNPVTKEIDDSAGNDIFSAATQVLPSPRRSRRQKMGQHVDEDIFSAATQVLPSPSKSTRHKKDKTVDDDIFSAATQVLPSPAEPKRKRGQNEEDIFTASTQVLITPARSPRKKENNLGDDIFSAATQKLDSPTSSVKTPSKNLEDDIFSAATQKLPSPNRSMRKMGNSLEDDIFCAATQILPSVELITQAEDVEPSCTTSTLALGGDVFDGATELLSKQRKRSKDHKSSTKTIEEILSSKSSRTTRGTTRKPSPKKRKLGSSAPEAYIEDSSDSNNSVDHVIEGSPESTADVDGDASTISCSPDRTEQDNPGNSSNSKETKIEQLNKSPIISRSSGRNRLSLNKSLRRPLVVNYSQGEAKVLSTVTKVSDDSTMLQEIVKDEIPEDIQILANVIQASKLKTKSESKRASEPVTEAETCRKSSRRNQKNVMPQTSHHEVEVEEATLGSSHIVQEESIKHAVVDTTKSADGSYTAKSDETEPDGADKTSQDAVRSSRRLKEKVDVIPVQSTKRSARRTTSGRKDSALRSEDSTTVQETPDNMANQSFSGRKPSKSRERDTVKQLSDEVKEESLFPSASNSAETTDVPDVKSKRVKTTTGQTEEDSSADGNRQTMNKVADSVSMPPPADLGKSASQPIIQPRQSRRLRRTASQPMEESSHLDESPNKSLSGEISHQVANEEPSQEDTPKPTEYNTPAQHTENKITEKSNRTRTKSLGDGMESKESASEVKGRRFSLAKTAVKSEQRNSSGKGRKHVSLSQQETASQQSTCEVSQDSGKVTEEMPGISTETRGSSLGDLSERGTKRLTLGKTSLKSEEVNQPTKEKKRVSFSQQSIDLEIAKSDNENDRCASEADTKKSSRTRKLAKKKTERDAAVVSSKTDNATSSESQENIDEDKSKKTRQSILQEDIVKNVGRATRGVKCAFKSISETDRENSNILADDSSGSQLRSKRGGRGRKNSNTVKEKTSASEESVLQPALSEEEVGEVSQGDNGSEGRGRKSSRSRKQKTEGKQEELNIKGMKRLPPTTADDELACDVIPTKVLRQSSSDLSSCIDENCPSTSILDVSTASSSLKRAGPINDSFASDAGNERKRRRGRLDSVASTNASPRRSPRQSLKPVTSPTCMCVLFTGYNNPRHESIVQQLGGAIVDTVDSCNVLVTDKLRRTVKLLATVGKGLPVVGPNWLTISKSAGQFLDPWEHILHDQEAEAKFSMKLVDSLHRAVNRQLLQDYHIYITKSVKPIPDEMKAIIVSCGGQVLSKVPASWPSNSVVISSQEDKSIWSKIKRNVCIVAAEWLLSGVLRQELDNEAQLLRPI